MTKSGLSDSCAIWDKQLILQLSFGLFGKVCGTKKVILETDSQVGIQLIERNSELDPSSLRSGAENQISIEPTLAS